MHWASLICLVLVCGCGSRRSADHAKEPTDASGKPATDFVQDIGGSKAIQLKIDGDVKIAEGVVAAQGGCEVAREEDCDAVDDDCDGIIDEGCGYGSGHIQVTLSWDNGSDIDLFVTDPSGDTISFQRKYSPNGGRMDHEGRGDCDRSLQNPRVENARWISSAPPRGLYRVRIHYWGACLSGGAPTNLRLSIAVGGRALGPFDYAAVLGERTSLLEFSVR